MKIYEAIVDDGRDVFKVLKACRNQTEMKEFCKGNGEIIRIKERTSEFGFCTESGISLLADTLRRAQYGQQEIDIITRLVADIA